MIACSIGAAVSSVCFGVAHAAAPKQTSVFGLSLGATPQAVTAKLQSQYRNCQIARSVYHQSAGETAPVMASLAVNPGLTVNDIGAHNLCTESPAGEGITDGVEATFAHARIEAEQPLYSIVAKRLYPDSVYAQPAKIGQSFDALRDELFRTYGKPIDERREPIASAAANLATSLGIAKKATREDYLVRYLWATKGTLSATEHEDARCDCGGPYVKAIIEISRSPSTIPRNKFYVLSVVIRTEDPDLRKRQEVWNAQWLQHKPSNETPKPEKRATARFFNFRSSL
jgi:hypothetical protein